MVVSDESSLAVHELPRLQEHGSNYLRHGLCRARRGGPRRVRRPPLRSHRPLVLLSRQKRCAGREKSKLAFPSRSKVVGVNIEDVMILSIEQAMDFFDNAKIHRKLQVMMDVGLGYLSLGQHTSTLSGGEIQRIKLSAHLGSHGRFYILTSPFFLIFFILPPYSMIMER